MVYVQASEEFLLNALLKLLNFELFDCITYFEVVF